MMRNLCCSAQLLLMVLSWGGRSAAVPCPGEGHECPAGKQPKKVCGEQRSGNEGERCQPCPPHTFSLTLDSELCQPHRVCGFLGRETETPGTATTNSQCGECFPGFQPTALKTGVPFSVCVKAPPPVRAVRTVGQGSGGGAGGMANSTAVRSAEERRAEYAVFALVPIFCVMGLIGILVCNILKKRGYRCSSEKEGEESSSPRDGNINCVPDNPNEDTISVLVRLITEKKENAAALEELLLEYESKQLATSKASIKFPVFCPHQSHPHTVSGLSGARRAHCCSRCAQRKWPPLLIPPLDALKDTLKPPPASLPPPITLRIPSLDPPSQQKTPLLPDECVDTHRTHVPPPTPAQVPITMATAPEREWPGERTITVGRFQVAQIPEHKPVTMVPKPRQQEPQRYSLFGGMLFSSSSSSSSSRR